MKIGLLTLHLRLAAVHSLKEKRSILRPLTANLKKRYNISLAEVGNLDQWQSAQIAIALVSNDHAHIERSFHALIEWMESDWRNIDIVQEEIEIIQ